MGNRTADAPPAHTGDATPAPVANQSEWVHSIDGQSFGQMLFNPTLIGATLSGSISSISLSATISLAALGATPLISTAWNVTNTDGVASDVQFQTANGTTITSAAGQSIWANSDSIEFNSTTPTTTGASYVARRTLAYAATNRGTASGAPGMWGMIIDGVDATGNNSSVSGQLLSLEIDVEAGLLDDANVRQGLVVVGQTRNYPTVATSEFVRAIGVFGSDPGVVFKDLLTLAVPFNNAGINLVNAGPLGGAPAIWLGDNHNIAWNTAGSATTHWNGGAVEYSSAVQIDGSLSVGTTMSVLGATEFHAGVQVDGLLYTPSNLTVGGTAALVGNVQIDGEVGFNTTAPIAKPTVTGAWAGNTAGKSLSLALQAYGLITDSTTA